ncbi:MAG TPA: hypothetical protein VGB98_06065 [Pyrinomonadaceae bacterium]|jgi:hypothetical protein
MSPQEMFGPPEGENAYVLPTTGVYGGRFYNLSSWPDFPACFFPRVESGFWKAANFDGSAGIREIIKMPRLDVRAVDVYFVDIVPGRVYLARALLLRPSGKQALVVWQS